MSLSLYIYRYIYILIIDSNSNSIGIYDEIIQNHATTIIYGGFSRSFLLFHKLYGELLYQTDNYTCLLFSFYFRNIAKILNQLDKKKK